MRNLKNRTIGQIVASDYRHAAVFKKFEIDFCCGGDITIQKACSENGIDVGQLLAELNGISRSGPVEDCYNNWSPDFLIDYIVNNFHDKIRRDLPDIKFYAEKVTEIYGQDHAELFDIYQELLELMNEITVHMEEEEQWLFPFIKMLMQGRMKIDDLNEIKSADIIGMLQHEHKEVGTSINKIRKLSGDYVLPEDDCPIYGTFFEGLASFEKDLRKLTHLENNILFPKILRIIQYDNTSV